MRSATGGSLPCLTSSASWGASLKALGSFAASVTTSGPSILPIRLLPVFCAMAAAATTEVSAPTARAIVSFERKMRLFMAFPFRAGASRVFSAPASIRAAEAGPHYGDIRATSPDRAICAMIFCGGGARTAMDQPRMAVRRHGSGPDLVLFHGGMGSWRHWTRNIDALAARFTVHVLDHPSYGDSATVPRETTGAVYLD